MKNFTHINASTVEEAVSILREYEGRAKVIAGGTDLIGKMKDEILPTYPKALVNIKTISGLEYIKEDEGYLKIGALSRLEDIAHDKTINEKYVVLAEAARRTASPHLREMGTLGGNICQDIRCWYYRIPGNRFNCLRKGGIGCSCMPARERLSPLSAYNQYHSIFGGIKGCFAVNPSDTAPALISLSAKVKTSKRIIDAGEFFTVEVMKTTVLDDDEIVTEIQVPTPKTGTKSKFIKFAHRKSIDFPIVNCASAITSERGVVKEATICLNAVYNTPYRATKTERYLIGKSIDESIADEAGEKAVEGAVPLAKNRYKIQIAKTLVKRTILSCL